MLRRPVTLPKYSSIPSFAYSADEWDSLSDLRKEWVTNGILVFPELIDPDLITAYCDRFEERGDIEGWGAGTPYMTEKTIRDICLSQDLYPKLDHILGEPVGLNLNLTGWISTERDWHQDTYLNPPQVGDYYVACWIALEDIHPDSGPFEYVEGSHTWPVITRDMVMEKLTAQEQVDPDWPRLTESIVTPTWVAEIDNRGAEVKQFLAKAGDVLAWHGKIVHRGSRPKVPGLERKALIAHYSGLNHRPDMPRRAQHDTGGTYFVF